MKPEDPEQYMRDLERGNGPTPGGGQFGGPGSGRFLGGSLRWRLRGIGELATTLPRWLIWACAVTGMFAIALFLAQYSGETTVHGNLVMINSGAKQAIECNEGNLKLDGDNNTYTITGHCRRLEIFGGANHVTVDSADTISVFGDDNAVIYHAGSPRISKTGNNNTVSQRPRIR